MAIYAIGDIQGCAQPLHDLLEKLAFNPDHDVLWCAGDLVNRGPDSLEVLRYLRNLGDACICVLGNHDLHLLAMAAGVKKLKSNDLQAVLKAHDAVELLDWLRFKPLLHVDDKIGWSMVHAGLHPQWSFKKHCKKAAAIEKHLRGNNWQEFVRSLYKRPLATKLDDAISEQVFATTIFTRTRYCTADGDFCWKSHTKPPTHSSNQATKKNKFAAWFDHEEAKWRKSQMRIVYGHWATKGLVINQKHVLGLDSGCVWGGSLSAAKLNDLAIKDIELKSIVCHQYSMANNCS
ncbi:MAG: symmetrical bis(5'-nucleosyl)-tetraphosphatase [Mariprofundales bacterium]